MRGYGALGGTRTPTILLTATSRQRVYQFRHERFLWDRATAQPDRRRDVTNRQWVDKPAGEWFWLIRCSDKSAESDLPAFRGPRQHLLDLDRDTVAVNQDHTACDRQVVGENLDLVRLGGVQLDDGASAETHYLMNRHRSSAEHDHEIDVDFINRCHWNPN